MQRHCIMELFTTPTFSFFIFLLIRKPQRLNDLIIECSAPWFLRMVQGWKMPNLYSSNTGRGGAGSIISRGLGLTRGLTPYHTISYCSSHLACPVSKFI